MYQLNYYETTFDGEVKKLDNKKIEFDKIDEVENKVINIYPQVKYQTINGFGGAVTDSAGYVYSLMNDEQKQEMIDNYFGTENMNYKMVRVPIDSCDFSVEHFEASSEENQKGFNLERMGKYIFPLLNDIKNKVGDGLEIMVTPWSPPAFMKTNGERNHGGKLKGEYRVQWAEYICTYVKELKKLGYNVTSMSIQNEPKAVQPWDSCVFTASEEKEFLRDYLYPALVKNELDNIKIFIWDHNKERAFDRACEIIDEDTDKMVSGVAVHWYSGDHFEALAMIKDKFPDKEIITSEACIEYCKFSKDDFLANAQKYAHDIIGNLNNGLTGFFDWNILLDEQGGPNHVGNFCDAPYLYDTKNNKLMERNTLAYIWHFSHFIKNGAVRIGVTTYNSEVEATAFEYNGEYIIVLSNMTKEVKEINIRLKGETLNMTLSAESIGTGIVKL